MFNLIITQEGKTNKPDAVLNMNTSLETVEYWINELLANHERYRIRMEIETFFNSECSERFALLMHAFMSKLIYMNGERKTAKTMNSAFFGTIYGVCQYNEMENQG